MEMLSWLLPLRQPWQVEAGGAGAQGCPCQCLWAANGEKQAAAGTHTQTSGSSFAHKEKNTSTIAHHVAFGWDELPIYNLLCLERSKLCSFEARIRNLTSFKPSCL